MLLFKCIFGGSLKITSKKKKQFLRLSKDSQGRGQTYKGTNANLRFPAGSCTFLPVFCGFLRKICENLRFPNPKGPNLEKFQDLEIFKRA